MYSGDKTKKKARPQLILLKVVVFVLLLGFIFWQLYEQDWGKMQVFHLKHPLYLLLSLVLIIANQGCEWFKWMHVAKYLTADRQSVRNAFFAGISAGFLSPNGWGNFIGRMIFFRKRDRMFIILSSFLSNVSQVLPTIFFGALACFYSEKTGIELTVLSLGTGIVILAGFFFGEHLLPKQKTAHRLIRHFHLLQTRLGPLRLPLFLWSHLRFIIFSLQYALLFMAFGYMDLWYLLTQIWLIFLLTSFIPSLWSGKIIIRETAALFVFSGSAIAVPDVILVSLLIWIFNIVFPAFVSSFVWFPVLKKQKTHVVD